jgi:pyruvate dehydrogenase E2 component (dihydrolipoamide acetyltransferase)
MSSEVRLPQWGMGMQEGTVLRWLKRVGDPVQAGEDLVEVEAAKTTQPVTAPATGVLLRVLVPEGETVPVRTTLAVVGAPSEASGQPGAEFTPPSTAPESPRPAARQDEQRRVPVTPVARKLARDLGVDLALVTGSGPGGRIDEADVRAYLERQARPATGRAAEPAQAVSAESSAGADRVEHMSSMRRAIARNMHASLQTMAQLTLFTELDATELVRLRERLQREFALTYTDLIVLAVARALRRHPRLNASVDGDQVRLHARIHIGLAVALEDGLIVPVIRDADRRALPDLAAETHRLAEQARLGELTAEQVSGSTFTATTLGRFGIDGFTPIINPPEVAILGVGRIIEKPAAYRGAIALRHMLTLSLTHDHRLVDGAPAAAFLQTLVEMLETPYFLGSAPEP